MLSLRLVIDTNVLISSALQRTVPLVAVCKPAHLYVSRPILEEYGEVRSRPGVAQHFPKFWKKTKITTPREFVGLIAPHLIR